MIKAVSLALAVALLSPFSTIQAQLTLDFTTSSYKKLTVPTTITIDLQSEGNGSSSSFVSSSGKISSVSGTLSIYVEAADYHAGAWTVDSDANININTEESNIVSKSSGWGVIGGKITKNQLLTLKFDVGAVEGDLRISNFATDVAAEPRYIVDGVYDSGEDLGPSTSFVVNTDIRSELRVGFTNGPYNLLSMTLDSSSPTSGSPSSLEGSRPNVVFFLGDDNSIFDHRTYEKHNIKVPSYTSNAFAEESLVFDQAFTGQTLCAPSRSMLYTGLYPVRNGCFMNHRNIRNGIGTLPTYLKELGYTVILAGKSHVKPDDQFQWSKRWWGVDVEGLPNKRIPIEKIRSFLANPGPNPFCIIVASEYPHGPYIQETPFKKSDVELPPYLDESYRWAHTKYYASIVEKEFEFKTVLELIDDARLTDDTVVMYSDDHGGMGAKSLSYEVGLHVAFMVRWPGKISPGRTSALVSFADFVPTMIDLAGGDACDLDGKSMIPIWRNPKTAKIHDYVYGVTHKQAINKERGVYPQRSIFDGRFHYVHNFNSNERLDRESINDYFYSRGADLGVYAEEELFDTLTDKYGVKSIADEPEFMAIKEALKFQLFKWMEQQNDFLEENDPAPFLQVDEKHLLDQDSTKYGYEVPDEYKGTLTGLYKDAHFITPQGSITCPL